MKAQRRHELQHNVLDQKLAILIQFFKKRGHLIAWGVLIVAIAAFGWTYIHKQQADTLNKLEAQFAAVSAAANTEATAEDQIKSYEELSNQKKSLDIAALSCIRLGDIYARQFVMTEPGMGEARKAEIADKAAACYRRVISEFPEQRTAVAKAYFALGLLAESRRDFAGAKKEWQAVKAVAGVAGEPVVLLAEEKLQKLTEMEVPVKMASTAPSQPATLPSGPTIEPTVPTTAPATTSAPAGVGH